MSVARRAPSPPTSPKAVGRAPQFLRELRPRRRPTSTVSLALFFVPRAMSLFSFFGDRSAKSNSQADSLPPASQVFDNATFSSSSSPSSSSSSSSFSQPAPTAAESLFSTSTYDPAKLHPMAGLGGERQLEYLTLEEDKTNLEGGALMGNRGFSDDVITGTGAAYVTGPSCRLFERRQGSPPPRPLA